MVAVAIAKHFDDFVEDQFDFHSYCLRKVTLRSYVSLIRFEDEVFGQQYFCEAAAGIIQIYLHLYDQPTADNDEEPDYSKMNAAEKKKAKAIARKKKKATEKKEAEMNAKKEENGNQKSNHKGGKQSVVEADPLGKEYLKRDYLEEAKKFASKLTRYAPNQLETWMLQYDVAIRRKKPMMALQALFKAKTIDPDSSEVFSRIVDFASQMYTFDMVDAVKSVVTEEGPALWSRKPVADFLNDAAATIKQIRLTDLPMRSEVAKSLVLTKTGTVADAASLITNGGIDSRKVSISSCIYAYSVLKSFGDEAEESLKLWTTAVQQRFPHFNRS